MEITFKDGSVREVDIDINALTLFKLQKEKVIDGNFLKGFMKGEDVDLDPISVIQGVYVAYRQANKKDYLKFEDFLENYDFNIDTDMPIYFGVISKQARTQFKQHFAKNVVSKGKN